MLRYFHLLLAGTLIAFVAVPALAQSQEAAKLIAAIEANGCVITGANSEEIQKASSLSDSEGKAAADELMEAGLVVSADEGYELTTPACAERVAEGRAAEVAPAVAALTAAIRVRDCRMTRAASDDVLNHSGLKPAAAETALEWMMEQGQLVQDGQDLQLKTEGCL